MVGFLLSEVVLLLELIKSCELLLDALLSDCLLGLLIGDLSGGPSAFDAGLEHVHTITLRGYKIRMDE